MDLYVLPYESMKIDIVNVRLFLIKEFYLKVNVYLNGTFPKIKAQKTARPQ
jgi:hypothetical protein